MISSATEFIKAGYGEEEAAELARISAMYQNVADEAISAADSSSFIIAQLAAFDMEASEAEHVIDAVDLLAAIKQGELTGKRIDILSALCVDA